MNADLVVQPIEDIREAVETLSAGLGRGEVFSPERWDRSVTTLARCHDQVGGDTRRQLYAIFGRCEDLGAEQVVIGLASLGERLSRPPRSPQSSGAWWISHRCEDSKPSIVLVDGGTRGRGPGAH